MNVFLWVGLAAIGCVGGWIAVRWRRLWWVDGLSLTGVVITQWAISGWRLRFVYWIVLPPLLVAQHVLRKWWLRTHTGYWWRSAPPSTDCASPG